MPTRADQNPSQLDATTRPAPSWASDRVGHAGGFVQRREPLDDAGSWLAVNDSESNAVIVGGAPDLVRALAQTSHDLGLYPVEVSLAGEAVAAIRRYRPQLTVLVADQPGVDVLGVARSIRVTSGTHLVILSTHVDPVDVLRGFDAGADEYIALPIGPRELSARFEALVRRSAIPSPPLRADASHSRAATSDSPQPPSARVRDPSDVLRGRAAPANEERWLRHGDVALNPDTGVVLVEQREVALTSQEFALLATLLQSRRRVRNRSDLALVLRDEPKGQWYEVSDSEKAQVDERIGQLRRKLGDAADGSRYIERSAEAGYRLSGDDRRLATPDAPRER